MLWKIAKAGYEPAVDFAAEELIRCLRLMDENVEAAQLAFPGYDPEIKDVLWLGVCPELAGQVEDPKVDDAYDIRVERGTGAIRGSNPRSVLMGVYRFLKELGCAWVRPGVDGEIIPKRNTEEVQVCLHDKASYRHRGICIEGAVSYEHVSDMIDWLPKVGYNAWFNQFNNPVTFYNRWYNHERNPLLQAKPLTAKQIEGLRDQSVRELKKRGLLYHVAGHGWTCEPFGIPGEAWERLSYELPEETKQYLALVNGERELWGGVPLNTNLCYSDPRVRQRIAEAVAERCAKVPEIDFVQVWLADGTNNHCECENCVKMRPADWYVTLLNEIDAKLTESNLDTKVVFLLYVDLLWEPQQVELKNPDRFVLMFAPITRTYSASIGDAPEFDEGQLPPYERNRLQFPKTVEENLAWMRRWRKHFAGDGFDFDYHFMWDHFLDPGYYDMAKILFRDMQSLHKVGLNGMVSCQNQRVFFPTGLGMTAMAAGLWNEQADFETVAKDYFAAAFGADGETVRIYMQKLSDAFDPVYLRNEKTAVNLENAQKLAAVPEILDEYLQLIETRLEDASLPGGIRASWRYLRYHSDLCRLMAAAFLHKAEGRFKEALEALEEVLKFVQRNERTLHRVFDVLLFQNTVEKALRQGMEA